MKITKGQGGYTKFEWENRFGSYEFEVRNVKSKNEEEPLQFGITSFGKKRSKYICFSLPLEAKDKLIEAIQKEC